MDGLLIIDKPAGPTSHDVVARMRRALGERRIGHTGTLDPAATGVLALVVGRATRLAQFLSDCDKSYEAVVRFGFATDTGDAQGRTIGAVSAGPVPSRGQIEAALDAFRGTFLQQPPAFSAKKIGGKRSHALARKRARDAAANTRRSLPRDLSDLSNLPDVPDLPDPPGLPHRPGLLPAPVSVSVGRLEVISLSGDCVTLTVDCSAGFYVRSLAHDLGERLAVGAHLVALRRTRAGGFTIDHALPLETAERDPERATGAIVPMVEALPGLPAVTLTTEGVRRALHGRELGPSDAIERRATWSMEPSGRVALVRLLDPTGQLVGIARPARTAGLLHPSVILG